MSFALSFSYHRLLSEELWLALWARCVITLNSPQKFREFLEGSNLISKLQAKHDLLKRTLGEGTDTTSTHHGTFAYKLGLNTSRRRKGTQTFCSSQVATVVVPQQSVIGKHRAVHQQVVVMIHTLNGASFANHLYTRPSFLMAMFL